MHSYIILFRHTLKNTHTPQSDMLQKDAEIHWSMFDITPSVVTDRKIWPLLGNDSLSFPLLSESSALQLCYISFTCLNSMHKQTEFMVLSTKKKVGSSY